MQFDDQVQPLPFCRSLYWITADGEVGLIGSIRGQRPRPYFAEGELWVNIHPTAGGRALAIPVAEAVVRAFIDPTFNSDYQVINYRDGDPTNCSVRNLYLREF